MAMIYNGERVCGATASTTGTCEKCGWRPDPYMAASPSGRHGGKCQVPGCGGRMICTVPIRGNKTVCGKHVRQGSDEEKATNVAVKELDTAIRGIAGKLPQNLRERYVEIFRNPQLLSIRNEVALFVLRQEILAERLETGESTAMWESLKEFKGLFESGNARMSSAASKLRDLPPDDPERVEAEFELASSKQQVESSLKGMFRLIDKASEHEENWEELLALSERAAELKRLQHARLKDLKQMIPAEQAFTLIGSLVAVVRKTVADRALLAAIELELTDLLRVEGPSALPCRDIAGRLSAARSAKAMPGVVSGGGGGSVVAGGVSSRSVASGGGEATGVSVVAGDADGDAGNDAADHADQSSNGGTGNGRRKRADK